MSYTRHKLPRWQMILRALEAGPKTIPELRQTLPISEPCIRAYLQEMRGAGLVRIPMWVAVPPANKYAAVYVPGAGRNAKKPKALTRKEVNHRFWVKISKDPERMLRRTSMQTKYVRVSVQPELAAFFGRPAA